MDNLLAIAQAALQAIQQSPVEGTGGVYPDGGGNYAVRFHTKLPTTTAGHMVLSMIVTPKVIYGAIHSEPDGGTVMGVKNDEPSLAGAESGAKKLIDYINNLG